MSFRHLHPKDRKYTWSKRNPNYNASRIDYFFVNYGVSGRSKCEILPVCCTDHSMIMMEIVTESAPKGKGYWKHNDSLLKIPKYVQIINEDIDNSIFQLSHQKDDEVWEHIQHNFTSKSETWSAKHAKNIKNNFNKLTKKNLQQIVAKFENLENQDQKNELLQIKSKTQRKLDNYLEN